MLPQPDSKSYRRGSTTETFRVEADNGKVTQAFAKDGVLVADSAGSLQLASNLSDVAYLEPG